MCYRLVSLLLTGYENISTKEGVMRISLHKVNRQTDECAINSSDKTSKNTAHSEADVPDKGHNLISESKSQESVGIEELTKTSIYHTQTNVKHLHESEADSDTNSAKSKREDENEAVKHCTHSQYDKNVNIEEIEQEENSGNAAFTDNKTSINGKTNNIKTNTAHKVTDEGELVKEKGTVRTSECTINSANRNLRSNHNYTRGKEGKSRNVAQKQCKKSTRKCNKRNVVGGESYKFNTRVEKSEEVTAQDTDTDYSANTEGIGIFPN